MCTLKSLMSRGYCPIHRLKCFTAPKRGRGDRAPTAPPTQPPMCSKKCKKKKRNWGVVVLVCNYGIITIYHIFALDLFLSFFHFWDIFVSSKFVQVHFSFLQWSRLILLFYTTEKRGCSLRKSVAFWEVGNGNSDKASSGGWSRRHLLLLLLLLLLLSFYQSKKHEEAY